MKASWRKYLGIRAPRYTSYPSALRFSAQVTDADYAARLGEVRLYEPLSLYIHVPFCRQLCWYCGCNMRVENDYARALRYVGALTREIQLVGERLNGAGRPLSAHFGGGTPNYLNVDEIAEILGAIELELGLTDSTRLAIELDPRLIGEGDIERLAGLGFNRMSLGVQDFDPDVQAAINRVQSYDLVESAVGEMRRVGVNDISFDLLYGLPKQTLQGFAVTLGDTIALSPDRVAVFGYAHLPAALPRQRMIDETVLPPGDLRADLAELADDMLVAAGYRRVGFDHYAKPDNPLARADHEGRLRRNFQGFTDDLAETTLGFGASAIGYVGGLYAQNAKTLADYYKAIDAGRLATARGLLLSPRDMTIAKAIRDLLCRSRADVTDVLAAVSPKEANAICASLDRLEADGVIEWRNNTVALKPEARPLSRVAAMALDPYEAASRAAAPVFARAI
ncbi:MAG: oxygen-independent coproporphyrinogen III oxidase [Pseudomonadota bacterium]